MTSDSMPDLESLLQHSDQLRSLAARLARWDEADDLVQETWLASATSSRPPTEGRAKAWLQRILIHRYGKHVRSETRRRAREGKGSPPLDPARPDELLARAEIRQTIAAAVLKVNDPYRRTLLWHYFEGWSVARIAKHEGVTASAVRSRLQRGITAVRSALEKSWGDDWRTHCLAASVVTRNTSIWQGVAVAILIGGTSFAILDPGRPATLSYSSIDSIASHESQATQDTTAAASIIQSAATRTEGSSPLNGSPDKNFVELHAFYGDTGHPVPDASVYLIRDQYEPKISDELGTRIPGSRRDLYRSLVPTTRTDSSGMAVIQLRRDAVDVIVQAPGFTGSATIPRLPAPWEAPIDASQVEVPMLPSLVATVKAVDSRGAALSRVPIGLSLRGDSANSRAESWEGNARALAFTNSDGIATLEVDSIDSMSALEALVRRDRKPIWEVWLANPSSPSTRHPLTGADLLEGALPVELQVSLEGELTVDVPDCPDGVRAFLCAAEASLDDYSLKVEDAAEGYRDGRSFLFRGVSLDQLWKVVLVNAPYSAHYANHRVIPISGPTTESPSTRATIYFWEGAWISGSLPPYAAKPNDHAIELSLWHDSLGEIGTSQTISLNPSGRFEACLDEFHNEWVRQIAENREVEGSRLIHVRFTPVQPNNSGYLPLPSAAEVTLPIEALSSGADVGSLDWSSAPLVASGRVLDAEGLPAPGLLVTVSEHSHGRSSRHGRWQVHNRATTDSNGQFFIATDRGMSRTSGDLRVVVSGPSPRHEFWQDNQIHTLLEYQFSSQAGPLDLRLPRLSDITFSFRNDLPEQLRASLQCSSDFGSIRIEIPRTTGTKNGVMTRSVRGLPAGEYLVELVIELGWTDLQRTGLGRVSLESDYKLPHLINVRESIEATRINLLHKGQQVSTPNGAQFLAKNGTPSRQSLSLIPLDGRHLLFHDALAGLTDKPESASGWISVRGYELVHVTDPWQDQEVHLFVAPEVLLSVDRIPKIEEDHYWMLLLDWLDKPDQVRVNPERVSFGQELERTVQLPSSGMYELRWQVKSSDGDLVREVQSRLRIDQGLEPGSRVSLLIPAGVDLR